MTGSRRDGRAEWWEMICANLSDIDESAHEILIAEGVDRLLSLFSCCVFHNPENGKLPSDKHCCVTNPHPYKTRGQ